MACCVPNDRDVTSRPNLLTDKAEGEVQKSRNMLNTRTSQILTAGEEVDRQALGDGVEDRDWGMKQGVGATALMVVWFRYLEQLREQPAFQDPYAERFLFDGYTKKCAENFLRPSSHFLYFTNEDYTQLPSELRMKFLFNFLGKKYVKKMRSAPIDEERFRSFMKHSQENFAQRTKYFDSGIFDAAYADIKQFVTMAVGCDARAIRLKCLRDSSVTHYLVDQPDVLKTLYEGIPELKDQKNVIPVPCRFGEQNWWDLIVDKGFKKEQRTSWMVEGLIMYLHRPEVVELFSEIGKLSAKGSQLMGDYINEAFYNTAMMQPWIDTTYRYGAPWVYGCNPKEWRKLLKDCGFTVTEDLDLSKRLGNTLKHKITEKVSRALNITGYFVYKAKMK